MSLCHYDAARTRKNERFSEGKKQRNRNSEAMDEEKEERINSPFTKKESATIKEKLKKGECIQ
jgi:hypothetical protein